MERTITANQIDFSVDASTSVFSDTLRFVIPVPAFPGGGELLVHPQGDRAGEPFTDRRGQPIQGRGIVFFDPNDRAWEVAPGDGSGVVVISPVTEDQASEIAAKVATFTANPNDLTLGQLKAILRYATDQLGVDATYASSKAFVEAAMIPVRDGGVTAYGLHRRRAEDLCRAVYVPGSGSFLGPAASPQRFEDGAVILRHGDDVRLVQCRSFEATYRFLDGRPARVSELAAQTP